MTSTIRQRSIVATIYFMRLRPYQGYFRNSLDNLHAAIVLKIVKVRHVFAFSEFIEFPAW